MRENYIVGNWKMNQGLKDIKDFFGVLKSEKFKANCHYWIAPQALHLPFCLEMINNTNFKIGSQNLCFETNGAFTGEISSKAIKELGCHFSIVGHSERRSIYKESYEDLKKKTQQALDQNLVNIFCIGETLEEREAGKTIDIVKTQLTESLSGIKGLNPKNFIVAYEPVWAIGTGKTASPEQAEEVHSEIRKILSSLSLSGDETSILYGGSVKPGNVKELMSQTNIDGALVGGASLKPNDFRALCATFGE